jgi:hypothetical protein
VNTLNACPPPGGKPGYCNRAINILLEALTENIKPDSALYVPVPLYCVVEVYAGTAGFVKFPFVMAILLYVPLNVLFALKKVSP